METVTTETAAADSKVQINQALPDSPKGTVQPAGHPLIIPPLTQVPANEQEPSIHSPTHLPESKNQNIAPPKQVPTSPVSCPRNSPEGGHPPFIPLLIHTCPTRQYFPPHPHRTRRFDATLGYPGEGPSNQWDLLHNLSTRINPAPTDWASIEYTLTTQLTPPPVSSWIGHNMTNKPPTTGLRMIHINIQQKGAIREDDTMFIEKILQYAQEMQGDVVSIQEPGRISPKLGSLIKSTAEKYGYQALVLTGDSTAKKGEGAVIFLSQPWQQVYTSTTEWPTTVPARTNADNSRECRARIIQLTFKAAHREPAQAPTPGITPKTPPLSQLAIFVVYGYSGSQNQKANRALFRTTQARIRDFRKSTPWGSVIVVGDLNVCISNNLDTDRTDLLTDEYEPEAEILQSFMNESALDDVFRFLHPHQKAYTHTSGGERQGQTQRRLDYVLGTHELVQPGTRMGIHTDYPLEGDHLPIICDLLINSAGLASRPIPTWKPHSCTKLKLYPEITPTMTQQFNDLFRNMHPNHDSPPLTLLQNLRQAAVDTVAESTTLEYPRPFKPIPFQAGWGFKISTWNKHLRGTLRAIQHPRISRSAVLSSLKRAKWPYPSKPEGLDIADFSNLLADYDKGLTTTIVCRLRGQLQRNEAHRAKDIQATTRAGIKDAVNKRVEMFHLPNGKGKRFVLNSIFQKVNERLSLKWLRDPVTQEIINEPMEVGQAVVTFFENWFKSATPVQDRWGPEGWSAMFALSTAGVDPIYHPIIQECYQPQLQTNQQRNKAEGWWERILDPILPSDTASAIQNIRLASAPGKSEISNRLLKLLDDDNINILTHQFNTWFTQGEVPDEINTAVLSLLPKTPNGLSDLNATRPIALMESILKVYEHIIIGRLVSTLHTHHILDGAQFGALPGGGTAAPLRTLRAITDDARQSNNPLYLFIADLTKAFDTLEYWSQALSWKCLDLPEKLIQILINLDSGSAQGGATTQVNLGQGRLSEPFRHGRGVRQGSVGGPLKWVVFVHYWITWVKSKLKGKGYKMSSSIGPTTLPNFLAGITQDPVEFLASLFIDDSIWATSSAAAMQDLLDIHTQFCAFHGIKLHPIKSELVSLNPGTTHTLHLRTNPAEPGTRIPEKGQNAPANPNDGRTTKYLGVHFPLSNPKWTVQQQVLHTTWQALLKPLKSARISLQEAIYSINTLVIPKLKYALQVATIPKTFLRRIDTSLRIVVRRAGNLPSWMPRQAYYLQKQDLGLGLLSLEDAARLDAIKIDYQCLTDTNPSLPNHQTHSLTQRIVEADWERHNQPTNPRLRVSTQGTLCHDISLARAELSISVEKTPLHHSLPWVSRRDAGKMREHTPLPHTHVYTDGSQAEENNTKTAGYGVATFLADSPTQQVASISERLPGDQCNFSAESQAILHALLIHHPDTPLTFFVDNQPAIIRTSQDDCNSPRLRSTRPARAIWNRIAACLRERAGPTTFNWVHSHPTETPRPSKVNTSGLVCACGQMAGPDNNQCDPTHVHHLGNDMADRLANQGRSKECLADRALDGEECHILRWKGQPCLGSIPATLKLASRNKRLEDMEKSEASRDQSMWRMITLSVPNIRNMISKLKTVSTRFLVRAVTDTLPTYHNEYKKVLTSTAYKNRYQDHINGGLCPFCHEPETLSHTLTSCRLGDQIRTDTHNKIHQLWAKTTKDGQSWALNSHYLPVSPTPQGWEEWWYWLGLVPITAWQSNPPLTQNLIKQSAKILAEAGYSIWTNRNAAVKEWEATQGIGPHNENEQFPHERPRPADNQPAKRGRPPKLDEDRSHNYRNRLAHKRRVDNLLQLQDASGSQIFTTKVARLKARKEGFLARKAQTLSQLAEHHKLRKLTLLPTKSAQHNPATPLDVNAIKQAITKNNPIVATPLTQAALLKYNREALKRRQRPVEIEYEIERIITDRHQSKQQEFLCKWKNYPLHQSTWIPKNLLKNAQEVVEQYLTSQVPQHTGTPTPPDQCQVICCEQAATSHNPSCKSQPPSARCSLHTLVACKAATSCHCGLEPIPTVPPNHQCQPPKTVRPPIPTSNRYQPLVELTPDPPVYEVERIAAVRTTPNETKQYYVKWVGYSSHHNTWEDESTLTQIPDILNDFLSKVQDPPPPFTRCQVKLCPNEGVRESPKCRSLPPSTRCVKHSSVQCGPATHCPCRPSAKRPRPLPQPPDHVVPPTNPPSSRKKTYTRPSILPPSPAHPQPESYSPLPPLTPSTQSPPHSVPTQVRPTPPTRIRQPKRAHPDTETSQPPPAKHHQTRLTTGLSQLTNRPQSKRSQPDSEVKPPPPAKIPTPSTDPSVGKSRSRGCKRVAKPGPRKKKTPHI